MIRENYCEDFVEDEAVRVSCQLVRTKEYSAEVYYFFPAFEASSEKAVAYFIGIENTGKETYAFFINDYHVNRRMVEEYDVVELDPGESAMTVIYLPREYLRESSVFEEVKSAGFRFVVRKGGKRGNIDEFDEQFSFLANGQAEPATEDRGQGKPLYRDNDVCLRFQASSLENTWEKTGSALGSVLEFRMENDCDFALNVSLPVYINGRYAGRMEGGDITPGCDRVFRLNIDEEVLEKAGIGEQDPVETLEVELELEGYTKPGTQTPWQPYLKEKVQVTFDD